MKYPDSLVARVLGAIAAGLPHKVIARAAEIPLSTVQSFAKGERRVKISPDDSLRYVLREWMKGN